MSIPIALHSDFDPAALRPIAKVTKDAAQGRRLLAVAEVLRRSTPVGHFGPIARPNLSILAAYR